MWNPTAADCYANDSSIPESSWVEPNCNANIMSDFVQRSVFRFAPSLTNSNRATTTIHFYGPDKKIQVLFFPNEEIVPFNDALCMYFTNQAHYLKCFIRPNIPLLPEPTQVNDPGGDNSNSSSSDNDSSGGDESNTNMGESAAQGESGSSLLKPMCPQHPKLQHSKRSWQRIAVTCHQT